MFSIHTNNQFFYETEKVTGIISIRRLVIHKYDLDYFNLPSASYKKTVENKVRD